jgi:hypothetical protein
MNSWYPVASFRRFQLVTGNWRLAAASAAQDKFGGADLGALGALAKIVLGSKSRQFFRDGNIDELIEATPSDAATRLASWKSEA